MPVLLPYPFAGPFDYSVPDRHGHAPARRAGGVVPLNRRAELGVVWDPDPKPGAAAARPVAEARLKPVDALLEAPPMPPTLRRFVDWVAAYTLTPPGLVLAMSLRGEPGGAAGRPRDRLARGADTPPPTPRA